MFLQIKTLKQQSIIIIIIIRKILSVFKLLKLLFSYDESLIRHQKLRAHQQSEERLFRFACKY